MCLLALCFYVVPLQAAPTTITYAHTGGNAGLERLVELFNAEHTDTKVEFQGVSDFWNAMVVQIAGGVGPDVMHMHPHYIRSFAESGLLVDLTPYVNRSGASLKLGEYFPLALEQSMVNGRYFSWPYGLVEQGRVNYNPDMFAAAGQTMPDGTWTWPGYQAIAQKLTVDRDGDGTPEQYGSTRLTFREIIQYNLAANGQFYSPDFRSFFSVREPALEAVNYAYGLLQAGVTSTTVGARQWREGSVAMLLSHFPEAINSSWQARERFSAVSIMQPMHANGNRRILVHSNGFAINPNSKHKDAAWEFITWSAEPQGFARAGREGWGVVQLMPPRRDVAMTPYFLQIDPLRAPAQINPGLSIDIAAKYGVPELVPKEHADVLKVFNDNWKLVERGELAPRAFYDTATSLIHSILRK